MTNLARELILLAALGLGLAACANSAPDDVPSLAATPTPVVQQEKVLSDEEKMMAFVECMRDRGIPYKDPVVDSEGNVQRPGLVEGYTATRKELREPYAACAHHIEGLTFGRQRVDQTEQFERFLAISACLQEKGYDVDEPTAETLAQWQKDFRVEFDWDDPKAQQAYQDCSNAIDAGKQGR